MPSIDNFTVVSGVRFAPRSDTIEELCDEFVVVEFNTHKNYSSESWYKLDGYCSTRAIIYGAIWTDKGLIYVAKMNKQGELELL